jgi:hypothetical protein
MLMLAAPAMPPRLKKAWNPDHRLYVHDAIRRTQRRAEDEQHNGQQSRG